LFSTQKWARRSLLTCAGIVDSWLAVTSSTRRCWR
jgi:hypothetical protein